MHTPCNPQLENGHIRIANELFDAIVRARLSRRQYAVLLAVTRKTYGYNRKTARISIRQIAAMTNLDRSNVKRIIHELVKMAVLLRFEMPTSRDGAQVFEMGLNKHYDQWRLPGCNMDSEAGEKTMSSVALPAILDGGPNDICPPSLQTGVKMTPSHLGRGQNDPRNGGQNNPPPGVKLTPPTIKDKKIKDNTKTTTPLSATQTSPHLRRGEAQGATAQSTTNLTPEHALTTGTPGAKDLRPEIPTTLPVETKKDQGGECSGSEPNATPVPNARMGANTLADHDAETPADVSTNCAESPAREEPTADFTLSSPETVPEKNPRRRRAKPDDERFDRFWVAYPRKRSKQQARAAFTHLAPGDALLVHILESLERAKATHDWHKENGAYIPYPATWLRAQGWLDEFATDAYTPAQFAVLEQYNTLMGEAGWPPAILAPYSVARASGIDDFLRFSPKPDMPERYFRYCARELAPHDGCGFDWLIRRDSFLRIREGVIAKRETRMVPQWA